MKKVLIIFFVAAVFIWLFIGKSEITVSPWYVNDGWRSPQAYIAHGGGVGNFVYTNSREALIDSLDKGFLFVEIDMIETSDGVIVGGHHWSHLKQLLNIADDSETPLSWPEIEHLKVRNQWHLLTAGDIRRIMEEHPQLILVTDKIKNYELLMEQIPFPDRMIVEVFSPEGYESAIEAGIKYPAFCVWNERNLEQARDFEYPIVTMDAKKFFEEQRTIDLVQQLHDDGVTILLFYTSFADRDKPDFVKKYLGRTVSKIYTDVWSPDSMPE